MKSVKPKAVESTPSVVPATVVRIVKIASCPSLSGKSKLTYHIGCSAGEDIHFRVFTNTGTGFFSREWVALSAVEQAFAKVPSEQCITSYLLYSLFHGKSLNTPAFLFAALKNEGLVQGAKDKQRSYVRIDAKVFLAEIKARVDSGTDLKVVEKSRPKNDDKGQDRQKSQLIVAEVVPAVANAAPDASKKKGRPKATPQSKLDLVQAS